MPHLQADNIGSLSTMQRVRSDLVRSISGHQMLVMPAGPETLGG
jgi:hypothetical protein